MPDYISIDWQAERMPCAEGAVSASGARIRHCWQVAWPEGMDPAADPEGAGKWLAEAFSRQGVRAREVLVSLPRQDVVIRNLTVPNVADEQLPNLVRLQAETISASSLDDRILDFLPLPRAADSESRQVLMATMASQKLDQIRQVVESAGLTLAHVGISSIATAELVARAEHRVHADQPGMTLVVAQQQGRLEISLMREDHLLFMHASQLADEDGRASSRAAWAEIRRALGAISRVDTESSVERAWLIGVRPDDSLARKLQDQLTCEISLYDLKTEARLQYACATDSVDEGFFAGTLGMLLASGQPLVEAVDFLEPRRTPEQIDHGRRRIIIAAATTLVAIGLAYGTTHWRAAGLDESIDGKQAEITRMTEAVEAGQPLLKAAASVAGWEAGVVDWLQVMAELNEILPGTDRIYLRDYQFKTPSAGSQAQIVATGYAKARRDVEALYQRLAGRKFEVRPHEISRTEDDAEYPFSFRLDVGMTQSVAPRSAG